MSLVGRGPADRRTDGQEGTNQPTERGQFKRRRMEKKSAQLSIHVVNSASDFKHGVDRGCHSVSWLSYLALLVQTISSSHRLLQNSYGRSEGFLKSVLVYEYPEDI